MPSFFQTHPRACALVLAATNGSRLFPMTSAETPKHLLPVAGIPSILRLLEGLAGFPQIVIAINAEDSVTLPVIEQIADLQSDEDKSKAGDQDESSTTTWKLKSKAVPSQTISVIKLEEGCFGPIDALIQVEDAKLVHELTRLVVFPGDLVFLQKGLDLDALLRPAADSACTALLVDVGETDEHGVPLKESSKAKKGLVAREEEHIDYIALSYPSSRAEPNGTTKQNTTLPRLLWKQSKMDVEADEEMTGATAKLELPKARLRHGRLVVRTDWDDVHVYSLAPWVRQLVAVRKGLSSIQDDLLPLLISRQFRGKKSTFGASLEKGDDDSAGDEHEGATNQINVDDEPFSVLAHVLPGKTVLRANTIPSYLFACKETVVNGASLSMPPGSKWNGKFQTVTLEGSSLGAKVNMKSSVVGRSCQLGSKCRLNSVIVMDNVTIGENCSLQNTVIGAGAKLGNNCSLNDCQVGPGKEIPAGTKEKGESFMVGDAMDEDIL